MTDNTGLSLTTHFGRQVQKARRAHGWTLRDLGDRTGINFSNLSKIENGHRSPTASIAEALDRAFPERDGWFSDWHRESLSWSEVPAGFRNWAEFEESARHLHVWSPGIINGLLQTQDYARALLLTSPGITDDTVHDRLTGRMERQRRVLFRDEPPQALFLVDEVSLYRRVGTPEVMAVQMRRLLEVAGTPRVTLQVLPIVAHPATQSGLVLADDAAYCEHMAAGYVYTEHTVVSSLSARFDALRTECYRGSESFTLIEQVTESWESGANPRIQARTVESA